MKTKLIYLLLVLLGLSFLCGCQSGEQYPQPTVRISYDNEARYLPDEDNNWLVTDQTEGGFLLKDKQFTYEYKNMVLIDATNETAENYIFRIEMSYLDENGDTLTKETQQFGEFASGYQRYFLFDPKIKFHSYVYNIMLETTDSDCWRSKISVEPVGMAVDMASQTAIYAQTRVKNESDKEARIAFKSVLIIDSDGEIYTIAKPAEVGVSANKEDCFSFNIVHASSKDELTVPEKLQNGYQEIAVIESIRQN